MKLLCILFLIIFSTLPLTANQEKTDNTKANCPNSLSPGDQHAVPGHTVFHEGKYYEDLIYDHYTANPGGVIIRPKGDRFENLKKAKEYIILLHGVGDPDRSTPNSMLHQYENYTGSYSSTGKPSYSKKLIINHEEFRTGAYVEILPLAGSNFGGTDYRSMKGIDEVISPIVRTIEEARRFLPTDAKITIHGRSYGATTAAAISNRYPGLIDNLVLVGLATPEKNIMAENMKVMEEQIQLAAEGKAERLIIDWEWTHWYDSIVMQDKWFDYNNASTLFGGAKTLILVGAADWQVSETERINYEDMSLKFSNVDFRLITSAPHDVTNSRRDNKRLTRVGVSANIYAFRHIFGGR